MGAACKFKSEKGNSIPPIPLTCIPSPPPRMLTLEASGSPSPQMVRAANRPGDTHHLDHLGQDSRPLRSLVA
jgi:hypothetical protein